MLGDSYLKSVDLKYSPSPSIMWGGLISQPRPSRQTLRSPREAGILPLAHSILSCLNFQPARWPYSYQADQPFNQPSQSLKTDCFNRLDLYRRMHLTENCDWYALYHSFFSVFRETGIIDTVGIVQRVG